VTTEPTPPPPKVLLLRDQDQQINPQAGMDFRFFSSGKLPSQTDLEDAGVVIYAGPVQDPQRGLELVVVRAPLDPAIQQFTKGLGAPVCRPSATSVLSRASSFWACR
jgi:hypothetical protein